MIVLSDPPYKPTTITIPPFFTNVRPKSVVSGLPTKSIAAAEPIPILFLISVSSSGAKASLAPASIAFFVFSGSLSITKIFALCTAGDNKIPFIPTPPAPIIIIQSSFEVVGIFFRALNAVRPEHAYGLLVQGPYHHKKLYIYYEVQLYDLNNLHQDERLNI